MGGVGSGNTFRINKKSLIDEVIKIDIFFMNQRGYLKEGRKGCISWSCNGEAAGSINFQTYNDIVEFSYRYRVYGADWEDMSISVSLTRTACHFGGYRHWFSCPNCSKRVGALYLEGTTPLCRKCSDIVYVSKNSSEIDQISNKINKLANYIYEDYFNGLGYKKKKGMHWITFERLSNKLLKLKQIRDRLIMDRLGLEL